MSLIHPNNKPADAAAPPPAGGSIQSIVSEALFDLDATQSDSYGGTGQTWANLVTSPHDGETQTTYDCWLGSGSGASSDDPSFTGTAGSSSAYFAMDGGDFFKMKTNTDTLKGVMRPNTDTHGYDLTWIFALQTPTTTTNYSLAHNRGTLNSTNGLFAVIQSTPRINYQHKEASYNSNTVNINNNFSAVRERHFIIKVDKTANTVTVWENGTKLTPGTGFTTFSADAAGNMAFGAYPSDAPALYMPNGTRFRAVGLILKAVTDTEATNLFNEYQTRHGNIY